MCYIMQIVKARCTLIPPKMIWEVVRKGDWSLTQMISNVLEEMKRHTANVLPKSPSLISNWKIDLTWVTCFIMANSFM